MKLKTHLWILFPLAVALFCWLGPKFPTVNAIAGIAVIALTAGYVGRLVYFYVTGK